jgi:hypothetical protein
VFEGNKLPGQWRLTPVTQRNSARPGFQTPYKFDLLRSRQATRLPYKRRDADVGRLTLKERASAAHSTALRALGKKSREHVADEVDEPVADHVGHKVAAPDEKEREDAAEAAFSCSI